MLHGSCEEFLRNRIRVRPSSLVHSLPGRKLTPLFLPSHGCAPGVEDYFCKACQSNGGTFSINERRAKYLLGSDMREFERCVRDNVMVPTTANEFSALVSFVFNTGCATFAGSKLKLVLNNGDYRGVGGELIRWTKTGGEVSAQLVRRRMAESVLFNQDHCGESKLGLDPKKKAAKPEKPPKLIKQKIP